MAGIVDPFEALREALREYMLDADIDSAFRYAAELSGQEFAGFDPVAYNGTRQAWMDRALAAEARLGDR